MEMGCARVDYLPGWG